MRVFLPLLPAVIFLALAPHSRAATYELSDMGIHDGFVTTGTITTNGTIGAITDSDIVSWSITSSDGNTTFEFDSSLTNQAVTMHSTSFTATADQILMPDDSVIVFRLERGVGVRDRVLLWDRRIENRFTMYDHSIPQTYFLTDSLFSSGPFVFATVPEPGTLLLLGLSTVACLNRRRCKRVLTTGCS